MVTAARRRGRRRELIERLLADDLRELEPRLERHAHPARHARRRRQVCRCPRTAQAFCSLARRASGKSTLATGVPRAPRRAASTSSASSIRKATMQSSTGPIDARRFASARRRVDEVISTCSRARAERGRQSARHCRSSDRPAFFHALLPRSSRSCARGTGRPHWIVVDEAHHLLPADWQADGATLPRRARPGCCWSRCTRTRAPAILRGRRSLVLAVGRDAAETLRASAAGAWRSAPPASEPRRAGVGRGARVAPARRRPAPRACAIVPGRASSTSATAASTPRASSARTAASTSAGPTESSTCAPRTSRLFLQIADGVDDDTWLHHLRQRRLLALVPRGDKGRRPRERRGRASRTQRDVAPKLSATRVARPHPRRGRIALHRRALKGGAAAAHRLMIARARRAGTVGELRPRGFTRAGGQGRERDPTAQVRGRRGDGNFRESRPGSAARPPARPLPARASQSIRAASASASSSLSRSTVSSAIRARSRSPSASA